MYKLKNLIEKNKILRYGLYGLLFIILAVAVSFCAIWIKYKVMDFEALNAEPSHVEYSGYYNSLNYKHQLMYDSIVDAAKGLLNETEVLNYSYEMEDFQHIIQCIRADRVELFYVNFNELVLYHSNHKTKVGMIYYEDTDTVEKMIEKYDAAVKRISAEVLPDMSDFEKEVAINDYLAKNCKYALGNSGPFASTAYGALVNGEAYCDGYAYAAKQLFNEARLDSYVVYGTADGAEHVWNMVEADGAFYHLDVMWNDADIGSGSELLFHGYFNLTDKAIGLDHQYENSGILPYATLDNNYYKQTGGYAESIEELEEVFYTLLTEAVKSKKEYIELCCAETKENKDLSTPFTQAVKRVNEDTGKDLLFEAFSVHEASSQSNSVTIQIFYND